MSHHNNKQNETATDHDDETGEVVEFPTPDQNKPRAGANARSQTGGFASHMRADLARSAVIYLEHEDPKRRHREKVVCAVNVGDFELHYPVSPDEPEKMSDDGRTLRRKMWDEAVQALISITAETGLNPKLVRNDKNSCRLVIRQDAVTAPEQMPDEFFSMELYYCSEFDLERRKLEHVRKIDQFGFDIGARKSAMFSWKTAKHRRAEIAQEVEALERDKAFFVATTPDPREMDSGLIFKVELFTLKEYGVTKEKLRTILSRYMNELSKVAAANGTSIPAGLRKIA